MITLFGKLKEHEYEIMRLKSSEEDSKMKGNKSIAFKASSSKASFEVKVNVTRGEEVELSRLGLE